jgi:hypothetical protein
LSVWLKFLAGKHKTLNSNPITTKRNFAFECAKRVALRNERTVGIRDVFTNKKLAFMKSMLKYKLVHEKNESTSPF